MALPLSTFKILMDLSDLSCFKALFSSWERLLLGTLVDFKISATVDLAVTTLDEISHDSKSN